MDQVDETFCKLCLKHIIDKKYQVLEVTFEVLSVLALNLNLDEKDNYMCNDCSAKLFAAFDFKVMCLNTEESLIPYVDSETASQIDLGDIYLKVKGGNATVTSNQHVCRLCMHIMDNRFMSLEELVDANIMDKYIPEVNFSITKDPVVCKQCCNSLGIHTDFLRKWMDIETKIKIEPEDPDDYFCIKSEEIDLKCEEGVDGNIPLLESKEGILNRSLTSTNTHTSSGSYGTQENCPVRNLNVSETICSDSDNKINRKSNSVVTGLRRKDSSKACPFVCACNGCSYRTKCTRHLLKHKNFSETRMHKCDVCNYDSKNKPNLLRHQLQHKDPSEVQMYKCNQCDYQCKCKGNLTQHQLRHRDPSEVQMYKCAGCDYQCKYKGNLTQHQLRHRDPSEVQMYKCDDCNYQGNGKRNLVRHQLRQHINIGERNKVKKYNCNDCNFHTNQKSHLIRHQLRHRDPSEVQVYKCDKCNYETKYRNRHTSHQLHHSDPSEVNPKEGLITHHLQRRDPPMLKKYKCNECDYRTNCKSTLLRHQLRHKDPSEVQMYKCDKCDYQTKRKAHLTRHQLQHRDPSVVQVYNCDKCHYQGNSKHKLLRHQLQHRDLSGLQIYRCYKCDFQTKHKGSLTVHQLFHHKDPSEVPMDVTSSTEN